MARKKKANDYSTGIPYHEVEALARVLLPEIQAFSRARKGNGSLQSGKHNNRSNKRNRHDKGGNVLMLIPPCMLVQKLPIPIYLFLLERIYKV